MASERFNRQFVLIDFEDLDNPEYLAFMRSPEFSTYMVMRRYIWRSAQEHSAGLHEYYARGYLVCSLYREALAQKIGVSAPSITRDISSLVKRGAIDSIFTGRQNIYVLGKWGRDEESDIYYEVFYLDRLLSRLITSDEAASSPDSTPDHSRSDRPIRNDQAASSHLRTINIESNRELNGESSKISKGPSGSPDSTSSSEVIEELVSVELETLIEICSREFDDVEHLESNLTRVFNLWAQTRFNEAEMLTYVRQARETTKERIGAGTVRNRAKQMAYFFRVLENILTLR